MDHKFVWWFAAQLEQELDLKRKPSKLSKHSTVVTKTIMN